jgi:5-methylcytosine-specific restriction endonuclease McrA
MAKYTKKSQTKKKVRTHRICSGCNRKRLIKFYEKPTSLKCDECKRKAKRVKKQSSPGRVRQQMDKTLREIIVKRDKSTCQWCMKKLEGRNCHMSHVYSKGAHPELRHDHFNVKILCYRCHIKKWHKDPIIALEWFKGKFPDRYLYLTRRIKNQ